MFRALHYNQLLSSASCLSITAIGLDEVHCSHESYRQPVRQEHEIWDNLEQEYVEAGAPAPPTVSPEDLDQLLDYPPLPLAPATPFVSGTPLPNLDITFDLPEISCLSSWEIPETYYPSALHQKPHVQVSHGHNVHADDLEKQVSGSGYAPESNVPISQSWSHGRSSIEEEFTPIPPASCSVSLGLDQLKGEGYSFSHRKKLKGVRTCRHYMKLPSKLKPQELRRRKLASNLKPTASTHWLADGSKDAGDSKKPGQPIKRQEYTVGPKNLVSERNRRIKLNERLYTLRALVPKISKMDRASIVADAIAYVKDLRKQLKSTQNDILALQAGTYVPSHRQASKGVHAQPRKQVSILQHKIIEMDVSKLEPTAYQLCIRCKREQGVLLQLIKALEALKWRIFSANLVTVHDLVINTIIIKVDGASKAAEDIKELLKKSFCTYGLHF